MTKQQFVSWAKARGWREDKWGHLQKIINNKQYRFKVSKTSIRYEVRLRYEAGGSDWLRIRSGYLRNLSLDSEGKLKGLR